MMPAICPGCFVMVTITTSPHKPLSFPPRCISTVHVHLMARSLISDCSSVCPIISTKSVPRSTIGFTWSIFTLHSQDKESWCFPPIVTQMISGGTSTSLAARIIIVPSSIEKKKKKKCMTITTALQYDRQPHLFSRLVASWGVPAYASSCRLWPQSSQNRR